MRGQPTGVHGRRATLLPSTWFGRETASCSTWFCFLLPVFPCFPQPGSGASGYFPAAQTHARLRRATDRLDAVAANGEADRIRTNQERPPVVVRFSFRLFLGRRSRSLRRRRSQSWRRAPHALIKEERRMRLPSHAMEGRTSPAPPNPSAHCESRPIALFRQRRLLRQHGALRHLTQNGGAAA